MNQADRAQEYLNRSFQFVGERLASEYVRAKMRMIDRKPGDPAPTPEEAEYTRNLARKFNYFVEKYETDIDSRNVADFICGLAGNLQPTEKQIAEMADLHDITYTQSAEMIRARRLSMLADSQRRNLHKHATIIGWLTDLEEFGTVEITSEAADEVDKMMRDNLIEQYKQAGKYASLEAKTLIESYAKEWDVTLPNWASVLPKWNDDMQKELDRVNGIIQKVEDTRQQELAQAQADLEQQLGRF